MRWAELRQKILYVIYQICPDGSHGVEDNQIAEKLEMDSQEIQDYLERLESEGYIKLAKSFGPRYDAFLEAEGRNLLREMELID